MSLPLLNSEETVAKLHSIIKGAKRELFLVSPYGKLVEDDRVLQSIRIARGNGVPVTIVMRVPNDGTLDDVSRADIAEFERYAKHGVHFRFVRWLHAKLYWSESAVLLTSMNLLSTSVQKSIEVGVYSEATEDVTAARAFYEREIAPFAESFGKPARASRISAAPRTARGTAGHCIRCGDDIAFNVKKPYCADDYDAWAEYENEDYVDKFCHRCGEKHKATMRKPLCRGCYDAVI